MIDKAPLDSAAGGWRRASPQKSLSESNGTIAVPKQPGFGRKRLAFSSRGCFVVDAAAVQKSGFSGVTVRSKKNFQVHGDGTTASAMSFFVKISTGQDSSANNVVKGGLIFPPAAGLPAGWSMGDLTEADLFRDAGVNLGVTGPAGDPDPFVGLAWRS